MRVRRTCRAPSKKVGGDGLQIREGQSILLFKEGQWRTLCKGALADDY